MAADAEALRTIADSTAVAGFIPTLSSVLHGAADALEKQDELILTLEATIQCLQAQARGKG